MNKIISYIGFALKSKKVIAGQTPLKRNYKDKIYVVLVCNTASDNLKNLAKNIAIKNECEFIITNVELEQLTKLKDIKIIGITDENLGKAIINNKEIINIG